MKTLSFLLSCFFLISLASAASLHDVIQGLTLLKTRGILIGEYIENIKVTQMRCPCFDLEIEEYNKGSSQFVHAEFSTINGFKLDKYEVKEIKD